jgi:hypothetical protein
VSGGTTQAWRTEPLDLEAALARDAAKSSAAGARKA